VESQSSSSDSEASDSESEKTPTILDKKIDTGPKIIKVNDVFSEEN